MAIKENTQLLIQAAQQGNAVQVQRLIPVSYSKFSENAALCYAARYGHTECVRLLIPVSDPTAAESVALYYAVDGGHIECVRLLIPVSNPKDQIQKTMPVLLCDELIIIMTQSASICCTPSATRRKLFTTCKLITPMK